MKERGPGCFDAAYYAAQPRNYDVHVRLLWLVCLHVLRISIGACQCCRLAHWRAADVRAACKLREQHIKQRVRPGQGPSALLTACCPPCKVHKQAAASVMFDTELCCADVVPTAAVGPLLLQRPVRGPALQVRSSACMCS